MKKVLFGFLVTVLAMAGTAFAVPYADYQADRPVTIVNGDDPSLQTILTENFDNALDADTDQSDFYAWEPDEGDVSAYAIEFVAGHTGSLYVFSYQDTTDRRLLLNSSGTSTSANFTINSDGFITINGVQDLTDYFGTSFGFTWVDDVDFSESSTIDYLSTDMEALALSYLVPDGTTLTGALGDSFSSGNSASRDNDWVLAFDDYASNDRDFNDAVFYMEDMAPVVPEPGTLLLLGSGLAGLAAAKRRKKS